VAVARGPPAPRGRLRIDLPETERIAVVAACGGDGTVSEVAQALSGTGVALAVVPAGTANVWAREALVPRAPERALALLAEGRRARVDLGEVDARIGGGVARLFLLMCSAGVDAGVVERIERHAALKRRLGRVAYAALAELPAVPASVTVDGDSRRAALWMAIVGNTRLYGGIVRLTARALANDGMLDLAIFEHARPGARLRHLRSSSQALAALRGRLDAGRPRGFGSARGRTARCRAAEPLRLAVRPRALEVVIGAAPNPLLGEA